MAWKRRAIQGAIRGLVSAAYGYSEARVAVMKARTQREKDEANLRLKNRLADIQERKNEIDLMKSEREAEKAENVAKTGADAKTSVAETEAAAKTDVAKTTADATKDVAETQAGADVDVAKVGAESAENVAKTQADASTETAKTAADASVTVAETQAGAQTDVAKTQADSAADVAKTQADSAIEVQQEKGETQENVTKAQGDAKIKAAEIEAQSRIDSAQVKAGTYETPEQKTARIRQRVAKVNEMAQGLDVSEAARKEFVEKRMRLESDLGYRSLLVNHEALKSITAFASDDTGGSDSQLVNRLKLMIQDSTASGVRMIEQMASGWEARLETAQIWEKAAGGAQLTGESRASLLALAREIWNANHEYIVPSLKAKYGDIESNSELKDAGVDFEHLARD